MSARTREEIQDHFLPDLIAVCLRAGVTVVNLQAGLLSADEWRKVIQQLAVYEDKDAAEKLAASFEPESLRNEYPPEEIN